MVAMVYTNPKQSLFSSNLNKTASSLQILEYGKSASYFNQSKKQVARLKKANSDFHADSAIVLQKRKNTINTSLHGGPNHMWCIVYKHLTCMSLFHMTRHPPFNKL